MTNNIEKCRIGNKVFKRFLENKSRTVSVEKDGVTETQEENYQGYSDWQESEYSSINLAKKANGLNSITFRKQSLLPA